MKTLAFGKCIQATGGRRVRALAFEERSMLPVSAACVVASNVRETLGALFGETVTLKLFEPTIPQPAAWNAIVRDARVYCVRAAHVDATVIVRPEDACALAAAAFGEPPRRDAVLSVMERTVLERTVRAIATQFGPICGAGTHDVSALCAPDLRALRTFFELAIERPVRARIGIALSRDPIPECQSGVALDDLLDLSMELAVQIDGGVHAASTMCALEPGALLPLPAGPLRGTLQLAGRPLATGECGVVGRYYALAVGRTPTGRDEPV